MTRSPKKFFSIILLVLVGMFQACTANRAQQTDSLSASPSEPIFLWRVSHPQKPDAQTMFLYGTIRAQTKELAYLDKSVIETLIRCDRVVLDYDPSQVNSLEFMAWLDKESSLPKSVFLKDQISKDLYARLEKVMDKKKFNIDFRESIRKMRPWRAAEFLRMYTMESWSLSETYGTEMQVAVLAAEDKKPVSGLQDALEQYKLYAVASPKDQELHLERVIDDALEGGAGSAYRSSAEDTRVLTDIYSRGDYQGLDAFLQSMATDPKSQPIFNSLVRDRAQVLTQRIQRLADDTSSTFIGIDLWYLAGPGNILDSLRKEGFEIERITPQGKVDRILTKPTIPFKRDRSGWALVETPLFDVKLPGEPKFQEGKLPLQAMPNEEMTTRLFSVEDVSSSFVAVTLNFTPAARDKIRTATPDMKLKMIGLFIDGTLLSKSTVTSSEVVDEPVPQSLSVEFKYDLGKGKIVGFEVDGEMGYLMFLSSNSTFESSATTASKHKFFDSLKLNKTRTR